MVTNSESAAHQWGWGVPIIHGYDEREWPCRKEDRPPKVVTAVSGWKSFHHEYNGADLVESLRRSLPITWIGYDVQPRSYDEYREVLGDGTIYLNPTRRSPMPGARTEAQLMGLAVVTLPGQDVEKYIEHGSTGYIVTEDELEDTLRRLLSAPNEVRKVGMSGAARARESFAVERFQRDWVSFLDQLL
jgi:glycosyltransferase involved in cell wall biosynthesis